MLAAGADEVYPAPRPSDDPSAWVQVQPARFEETWTVPTPDAMHAYTTATRAWNFPQIRHGIERGLGVASAADVELIFESVATASELETIYRAT
jgi:hypothetical protein